MMKEILVVLMAMLTMVVLLTGCGGDSKKAAYPADGDISVIRIAITKGFTERYALLLLDSSLPSKR